MFFKANRFGLTWTSIVIIICLIPGGNSPGISFLSSLGLDKIIHFLIHLILVYLVAKGLLKSFPLKPKSILFFTLVYSLTLGIVLEIVQSLYVIGRSGDYFDVLANFIGAIFGVLLVNYKEISKAN